MSIEQLAVRSPLLGELALECALCHAERARDLRRRLDSAAIRFKEQVVYALHEQGARLALRQLSFAQLERESHGRRDFDKENAPVGPHDGSSADRAHSAISDGGARVNSAVQCLDFFGLGASAAFWVVLSAAAVAVEVSATLILIVVDSFGPYERWMPSANCSCNV